jgi:exopolyphosphatase / guanosine-5'-triphosphate,3'-diphosphate pyrophosphatase
MGRACPKSTATRRLVSRLSPPAASEGRDVGLAAGGVLGCLPRLSDGSLERGDEMVELPDERHAASFFRVVTCLSQALSKQPQIVPAADRVLNLLLHRYGARHLRDAGARQIFSEIARFLDRDAVAVELPVARRLRQCAHPRFGALPLALKASQIVVVLGAREPVELALDLSHPLLLGGALRLPTSALHERVPSRLQPGREIRGKQPHLPDPDEQLPLHFELPQARKPPHDVGRFLGELAPVEGLGRRGDTPQRDAKVMDAVGLALPENFLRPRERMALLFPDRVLRGHGSAIIRRKVRNRFMPSSHPLHRVYRVPDQNRKAVKKLAAIDIGTNSIKLLVASVDAEGSLEVLSREKAMVRLGSETLATGRLSPEAIEAAASTVEQFLRSVEAQGAELVRAVATCAVREATNSSELIEEVRRRTGVTVDVVSGEEEARLINLAVRSEFPSRLDPLFMVDIGGGSTEFVISNGARVLLTESLPLGVVRLAARYLRSDPLSDRDRKAMKKEIRAVAKKAAQAVRKTGFKTCVGSSGTIQSLSLVFDGAILGREVPVSGHRTLTRKGLKKVNRLLRRTNEKEKLRIAGLDPRRRDIAGPGGILLAWILKRTGAESIVVGERGLREGILLDYTSQTGQKRDIDRDVRARSIDRLLRRGNAEVLHAAHVARLALEIFDRTHALHQLTATEREWLQYGALLHDIGCYVGYARHQRHSYYLITHGDLTGFSAEEVEIIASLARYHKGGGPKARHENWQRLNPYLRPVVEKLAAMLRIADGLDRSHRQLVDEVECRVRPRRVDFSVTARADCEAELDAARRKADLFERVFDRRAVFRAVPAEREEETHQKDLEMISAEALWS